MGSIDNFDVSEKEKERYKTGLQDVWNRYPFNITKDDYPFMAELGPMIEAEAFSIYSAEELEAMRTADMSDEPPRHPFMNELGLITTSSARNEEEEGTRKIDYSNSQFADNNSEQEKGPGFTGIMTTAVVVLCFYLVRKWK